MKHQYIRNENNRRFEHEIERRERRKYLKSIKRQGVFSHPQNDDKIAQYEYKSEPIPDIFCLFTNPSTCISFFNNISSYINEGKKLFLDMKYVKKIDASSVIYLLSVLKNLKHKNIKYSIRGSFPKSIENYQYLVNTGFLNYVDSRTNSMEISKKSIMIKEGEFVQGDVAKKICDFIINNTGKYKVDTKPYYEMIIELMNNTKHHAYDSSEYVHNWYVYCDCKKKKVQITFFDNGAGIPATVNKTKIEALTRWFNNLGLMIGGDIDILKAAFDGAFKTRTQEEHRGKGLPMIKELIDNNKIKNVKVITNHAYYSESKRYDINQSLQGTLYYWEIE